MCDACYADEGLICRAYSTMDNVCPAPDQRLYRMSLPAEDAEDALEFLSGIGGTAAGGGRSMRRIGIDAPALRSRYKREVEALVRQIAERLERGDTPENVARWPPRSAARS